MSSERSEVNADSFAHGLVNVPDPNGTGLVAVTLSTQHILSQASTYSLKGVDFSDTSSVQKKLKTVREYLTSQEAVVGANGLMSVAQHFCKSIFKNTPYERIFPVFWKRSNNSWSTFLDKIGHAIGVPADHRLCDLAIELQQFVPAQGNNLRSAIFDYAGKIQYLSSKNASLVPHQLLLTRRLLQFMPVNQQHLLPTYVKEPANDQLMDDYVEGLMETALEIHPKIMPHTKQLTANHEGNPRNRNARPPKNQRDQSGSNQNQPNVQGNPQLQDPRGPQNDRNTKDNNRHPRQDNHQQRHNNQHFRPAQPNRYQQTPQTRSENTVSSAPRFVNNRPPPTSPKSPQVVTGDILMDGTGRPDPTSPSTHTKQLGRLMKIAEEQNQQFVFARIDTGADAHIAGKEVSGNAIPDGVHKSLFAVPLQRKKLAAECVKFSATTENGEELSIRAVHSPSTNTCLAPSAVSFNIKEPKPDEDFAIINDIKMPVHVINGQAYVKLSINPARSKTIRDFCTQMGLNRTPTPTEGELVKFMHTKLACAGTHTLDITFRILGFPITFESIKNSIGTCERCPQTATFLKTTSISSTANLLNEVSPLTDTLVFDGAELPNVSERGYRTFLVAKLVNCGRYYVLPTNRGNFSETLQRIVTSSQVKIVKCMSDRSKDFSRFKKFCEENNITYIESLPGRDEYKGFQEGAVSQVKRVMEWFHTNWDYERADDCWDVLCYCTEHVLNTRASVSRHLIPFHVVHGVRPRYDLTPLQVVTVVRGSKRLTEERTEPVIFLCQRDAQTAIVWRFMRKRVSFEGVHINAIRANKLNLDAIEAFLKPPPQLNALSVVARTITPQERRTEAWRDAIREHANKLVSLNFAKKSPLNGPQDAVRSFFVGRNMDGALNARLVANGGLSADEQTLDQYLPSTSERFAFLSLFARMMKDGYVPWSGDISGAYYATKGEGFIRLPHDWPSGIGGFMKNEIVSLNCAIPGDKLSSGLFLSQLDELLVSEGIEILIGRIKRMRHACGKYSYMINYSDDLLGFSPSESCMKQLETLINKKFRVELSPGVPPKWVGMDMHVENQVVHVSSASSFLAYDLPQRKFTLKSLQELELKEKTTDEKAKKEALSMIGKLLYGATFNPWLTYLSSFLASALHYDPIGAAEIASAAIYHYGNNPPTLVFNPIQPTHLVVYCDASHSLVTGRAHAGCWIQLQDSDQPSPRSNPVCWGSQRLARVYESVYSAEAKAAE